MSADSSPAANDTCSTNPKSTLPSGPLVSAAAAISSGSAPSVRISHLASEPISSDNLAPPSTCAPHIPTDSCQVQALTTIGVHAAVLPQTKSTHSIEPSPHSSVIWAKALEVAKRKLGDYNLPPLDIFTSEERIEKILVALNTFQEDAQKRGSSYTWRGKEVKAVERLGRILKSVEEFTRIVGTAMHSPEVIAVIWGGIWVIMQVRIKCTVVGYHSLKLI